MENAVLQRIKALCDSKGLNKASLARAISMPHMTVNQYMNGERKFSFEFVQAILNTYGDLSAEWLIKGDGDMYKSNTKVFVSDRRMDESVVPLYDLDVSAGLSKLFVSGGDLLGNISIPNMPRADGALHVTGDSMYPLIKAG